MNKKRIKEQIDYGGRPERMDPNLERKLGDPESLYAKNPSLRRGVQDVERLVSSRFGKVVDKLKDVTGIQDLSTEQDKQMLMGEMLEKARYVMMLESSHKEQLKELAVEICLDETEADPSWYIIDPHLGERINVSNFRYRPEKPKDNEKNDDEDEGEEKQSLEIPSFDVEDLTPEEEFELEKHKRNIINALIQGAAKKGHYVFQKPEVKRKLDRINPSLYPNYVAIMAINDFFYFTMEDMIDGMSQTGQGVAGKVELKDTNEDDLDKFEEEGGNREEAPDTKIVASGAFFPILCHEIIKGIESSKGRHGLPKDPTMRANVKGQTDTLPNEPMQLRIGPEIYEKLRFTLPDEMFDEDNKGLINWFHIQLYQIPAQEFLKIMGDVISDDESKNRKATERFEEIMREAQQLKSEFEDWKKEQGDEPSDDSNDSDDDDDDLDDFLSGLGISRPK
jgi:hypothetical protein